MGTAMQELVLIAMRLNRGERLFLKNRMWLPFETKSFEWASGDVAAAKAIRLGGRDGYLTISPVRRVGDLSEEADVLLTDKGLSLLAPDYQI